MFEGTRTFSSFAVDDVGKAREFYGETLGLDASIVDEATGLMTLRLEGNRDVFVYERPDHTPAAYTILNFVVEDVERAVDDLASRGVRLERYEGFEQDEKGIARGRAAGRGPDIAWFTDPAGNVLAVLDDQDM